MVKRLFGTIFALLLTVLLVTLAVTNRKRVTLVLDPFQPENPAVALDMPFYFYLFAMLILGALIGGFAMWMSQSKWRRMARLRAQEALKWKGEADRLMRERDDGGTQKRALAVLR